MKIDFKLLLGSSLFGIGWGWAGICLGPSIVSFGAGVGNTMYFTPSMIAGMYINDLMIHGDVKSRMSSISCNQ